jgi:phospholipid/cholesterol/gamma-HCH transport system substrate-binding protein
MQSLTPLRNTAALWGVGTLALAAALVATAALVYVSPPGQKAVVFFTDDAASIRSGDSVRIAGVPVGKVGDIEMESDRVRVEAHVDRGAFVGDQTQVEVRMLTIVGGYYVNLVSLGSADLGATPIPVERVRMPYSLVETLTDATKITHDVDAPPVRSTADQLQTALQGSRLDSLSSVLDAGNGLIATVERQRGQISRILSMSSEYLQALASYRGQLSALIDKAAILERTLELYGDGFGAALLGLGDIGQRIKPFGDFYVNHRAEVMTVVDQIETTATSFAEQATPVIEALRRLREQMQSILATQNPGAPQDHVLATSLCVPLPGSPC